MDFIVNGKPSTENALEPERPEVLGTPHVADIAGDNVQSCKRCDCAILDLSKPEVDEYDEGDLVGVSCQRDPVEEAAPTSAAEALEQTAADLKVCLCQDPRQVEDGRCAECGGTVTGEASEGRATA